MNKFLKLVEEAFIEKRRNFLNLRSNQLDQITRVTILYIYKTVSIAKSYP